MSAGAVLTLGYGPAGGAGRILSLGYGISPAVVPEFVAGNDNVLRINPRSTVVRIALRPTFVRLARRRRR